MSFSDTFNRAPAAIWEVISPFKRPLGGFAWLFLIGVSATELYAALQSEEETNDVESLYGLSGGLGRAATDLSVGMAFGAVGWFTHHAVTSVGLRFRYAGKPSVLGGIFEAACLSSGIPSKPGYIPLGDQPDPKPRLPGAQVNPFYEEKAIFQANPLYEKQTEDSTAMDMPPSGSNLDLEQSTRPVSTFARTPGST